jgi:hypothetical protein
MGALSKLTFGGDEYGPEWDRKKPAPATLEVGMTELDFSNKNLGVGGAIIISAWITHKDNGALSVLSLKKNGLGTKEAGKVLGEMLKANTVLKELDLSDNVPLRGGDSVGFAQELAAGIKDNGAMTGLNLAENFICMHGIMDGIKAISSAVKVLAFILVPFLSLSDLSFNCWCLLLSPGYEGVDHARHQQELHPVQAGMGAPAHLCRRWHRARHLSSADRRSYQARVGRGARPRARRQLGACK